MHWIGLVAVIVLASCDGSGVQFVVNIPADYGEGPDADPMVQLPDEVRLFIGVGEEHMDRLGPEGFNDDQKRSGTYWLRERGNMDPEIDRAPISIDSPAVFSYVRSGALNELGVVVAVGYTNGVPTSSAAVFHAAFGEGVVLQYFMGLNGAADPRRERRTQVNQLEIWGADECVYVDNRRSDIEDEGHRVAFIVGSVEDRDCDGLLEDTPLECNADVHLGAGPSANPSCLLRDMSTGICRIGAPRCKDGVGGDDLTCRPTRFCAAPQVCAVCSSANVTSNWACAQKLSAFVGNGVGTYGLECSVPAVRSATQSDLCTEPIHVTIDPPPGTTCENVTVKALVDPAFDDTFTLDSPENNGASIKVSRSGCALKLEPDGVVGITAPLDYSALMLVELDEERGIAAPVHVEVVPDMGSAGCGSGSCTWVYQPGPDSPDPCVLGP